MRSHWMRTLRLSAALLAFMALSGCVAAIPLAASGIMVRGDDGEPADLRVAGDGADGGETPDADIVVTAPPANANRTEDFVAMALYAIAEKDSGLSALANPAAEEGESPVFACNEDQLPAILVDLDPGDIALQPDRGMIEPAAGLGTSLMLARQNGLSVLWTSVLDENRAGAVRAVLTQSGLDAGGADTLLLTRDPAESKTARRAEVRDDYCIKAIVGDRRGDFDEFMNYLRDTDAPTPYDAMFGKGWFELPPPLDYPA